MKLLVDNTSPSNPEIKMFHKVVSEDAAKMAIVRIGSEMDASIDYTKKMMIDTQS